MYGSMHCKMNVTPLSSYRQIKAESRFETGIYCTSYQHVISCTVLAMTSYLWLLHHMIKGYDTIAFITD